MLFFFTIILFLVGFGKNSLGQNITVSSLIPATICPGNNLTVNFNWDGMSNANQIKTFFAQYESPANTWNNIGSISISGGGNGSGTSSVTSIGPGVSGTFKVRVIRTTPNPQVISTNTLSLTVIALTTPTGIDASPSSICLGEFTTLSVTDPGAGFTTDWFTGSCGGTAVSGGTGVNSLSVNPAISTTYFARTRNTTTGCVSSTCASVTVTVYTLSTEPFGIAASPATICNGSSTTISVTDPGAGFTTDWFTGGCGGTIVSGGTGVNSLSVNPTTSTTYFARTRNTVTGCISSTCANVTVTVNNANGVNANGQVEWISKIDIGSYSNTSGASGYSDFTSEVVDIEKNATNNIILTPGFSASSYDEYWRIWIDFNEDGDYSDSGELLFSGNSTIDITNSISIPDVTVNTTMRIAMKGYHPEDVTVTGGNVTSQFNDWPVGEDITKLVDNNSATKYLTFHNSGWVQYQFPSGNKHVITKYSMTSANDSPERDPLNWTLQGSIDGSNWTTIDTRNNEDFTSRFLRREFICTNNIAYEYYRLNMTNNSGTILQIAEWELFEIDDTPYPESCETFSYGEVEDYSVNIAAQCNDATILLNTRNDDQTVCEGESISIIEYAIGGGATGVDVTNLPIGVTGNFVGGILTISGTPTENETFVYSVITNGTPTECTEASVTGTIVINPLPAITTQPYDLTICEGESGSFTVSTSASSPTYQWGYATSPTPALWIDVPEGGDISGTETAELDLINIPAGFNGFYVSCLVTANGCETRSSAVILTVNPLPDTGEIIPD